MDATVSEGSDVRSSPALGESTLARPQLVRADLCAAPGVGPINTRTAVVRASQRLGDDTVSEENPEGLADARCRIRRREGAPVTDAYGRYRRGGRRIVRCPFRPGKA